MNPISVLWYVLAGGLVGGFMVFFFRTVAEESANKKLAQSMLKAKGLIEHEAKPLVKKLQEGTPNDQVVFTLLRNLCNIVCLYIRLGGSYDFLNAKIATMASMCTPCNQRTTTVVFAPHPDVKRAALITIGFSGRKYILLFNRMDGLDILTSSSPIK